MEKNNEHIDLIFKQKFEQLPDHHNAGSWDQPSASVWNNIQKEVQLPGSTSSGLSLSAKVLIALAALIGIGLLAYFAIGTGRTKVETPKQVPSQQTMPAQQQPVSPSIAPKTEPAGTRTHTPAKKPKQTGVEAKPVQPQPEIEVKPRNNIEKNKTDGN
jgi:outer membrane biosynthesis protein TonB